MAIDWHKVNKRLALGLTGEQEEKITDFFWRISRRKIKLLPTEKVLCEDMGVDPKLAAIVKSSNEARIRLLPAGGDYNVDFDRPGPEGICSFWANKNGNAGDEINRVIYRNKLRYRDLGYNLFTFDTGSGWPDNNYLAVAKGKTDLDILRWRGTDGTNHGIDNDAIVAKVEEWQQKYDLVLWGCGADWMQIFFVHEHPEYLGGTRSAKYYEQQKLWDTRTPKFRKFAEEVIEFCPDLVEQIHKNKTALIKDMERVNGVYFWWD